MPYRRMWTSSWKPQNKWSINNCWSRSRRMIKIKIWKGWWWRTSLRHKQRLEPCNRGGLFIKIRKKHMFRCRLVTSREEEIIFKETNIARDMKPFRDKIITSKAFVISVVSYERIFNRLRKKAYEAFNVRQMNKTNVTNCIQMPIFWMLLTQAKIRRV